mmetsp:Transcript_66497/g.163934  ORF Transcript_66497/g.163934 Transcript_66497/m.163934 type:complete len:264 (+) Transcript_66497:4713-5504(+)
MAGDLYSRVGSACLDPSFMTVVWSTSLSSRFSRRTPRDPGANESITSLRLESCVSEAPLPPGFSAALAVATHGARQADLGGERGKDPSMSHDIRPSRKGSIGTSASFRGTLWGLCTLVPCVFCVLCESPVALCGTRKWTRKLPEMAALARPSLPMGETLPDRYAEREGELRCCPASCFIRELFIKVVRRIDAKSGGCTSVALVDLLELACLRKFGKSTGESVSEMEPREEVLLLNESDLKFALYLFLYSLSSCSSVGDGELRS